MKFMKSTFIENNFINYDIYVVILKNKNHDD